MNTRNISAQLKKRYFELLEIVLVKQHCITRNTKKLVIFRMVCCLTNENPNKKAQLTKNDSNDYNLEVFKKKIELFSSCHFIQRGHARRSTNKNIMR